MAKNLITVAPGVYVDPTARKDIEPGEEYVLLDNKGLKRLGLTESQQRLILRLERCGMVVLHQITPRRRLLRLSSWQQHLENVNTDPDFWDHPETLRRWRIACMDV